MDIAHWRLYNQQISWHPLAGPADLVAWLGAVQAQDYAAAKWAVGQRVAGATDAVVEQAFTAGAILRTHVLRPTWHFVAPADIRWMLALTAPRVNAASAYQYRQLELDDAVFARSNPVLVNALAGGKQLTRTELGLALQQAGIPTHNLLRVAYIIGRAELDGLVCSGGRRGKQFTYALLEERAPPAPALERDEALAKLALRYFTSHGPATVPDFVWWSGLTGADARAALAMLTSELLHEVVHGQTYWFADPPPAAADSTERAYLLPNFDEYIVGYKDRSAVFDAAHTATLDPRGNILFSHTIVINGQIVGTWKRTLKKDAVIIEANPIAPLSGEDAQAFTAAAARYGRFLGVPTTLAE